ncbi:hypothetical protein Bca101_090631 [Brassica carinata]
MQKKATNSKVTKKDTKVTKRGRKRNTEVEVEFIGTVQCQPQHDELEKAIEADDEEEHEDSEKDQEPPDLVCSETNRTWHLLRTFRDNCVVLSFNDILVYNTFFDNRLDHLIDVSQTELTLLCSDVEKDRHVLKMSNIVACLDIILVYNVYFDVHLEKLKCVLLVLEKDILIFELNKYLSCTYDPGILVFECPGKTGSVSKK